MCSLILCASPVLLFAVPRRGDLAEFLCEPQRYSCQHRNNRCVLVHGVRPRCCVVSRSPSQDEKPPVPAAKPKAVAPKSEPEDDDEDDDESVRYGCLPPGSAVAR